MLPALLLLHLLLHCLGRHKVWQDEVPSIPWQPAIGCRQLPAAAGMQQ
jgi:hypothetical protein